MGRLSVSFTLPQADGPSEGHAKLETSGRSALVRTQSFQADADGYVELLSWFEAFAAVSKLGEDVGPGRAGQEARGDRGRSHQRAMEALAGPRDEIRHPTWREVSEGWLLASCKACTFPAPADRILPAAKPDS